MSGQWVILVFDSLCGISLMGGFNVWSMSCLSVVIHVMLSAAQ